MGQCALNVRKTNDKRKRIRLNFFFSLTTSASTFSTSKKKKKKKKNSSRAPRRAPRPQQEDLRGDRGVHDRGGDPRLQAAPLDRQARVPGRRLKEESSLLCEKRGKGGRRRRNEKREREREEPDFVVLLPLRQQPSSLSSNFVFVYSPPLQR